MAENLLFDILLNILYKSGKLWICWSLLNARSNITFLYATFTIDESGFCSISGKLFQYLRVFCQIVCLRSQLFSNRLGFFKWFCAKISFQKTFKWKLQKSCSELMSPEFPTPSNCYYKFPFSREPSSPFPLSPITEPFYYWF